jgi:hypothetical protein
MKKENNFKKIVDVFIELKSNPIDFMRNTTFKRSELKLDARVANHWAEKGLFPKKYETGSWFIFDLVDAFWIKIIMKLREYNTPLDVIKLIKEEFFKTPKSIIDSENKEMYISLIKESKLINDEHFNYLTNDELWDKLFKIDLNEFELMLQSILLERKEYYIILNLEGNVILSNENDVSLMNNTEYCSKYQEITSKSHLRISMNEIINELVTSLGELTCSEKIPILTKEEAKIITLMRTDNISSLNIRYNSKSEYETIEVTTVNRVYEQNKLSELIVARGYQNIVIKTQNGNIVHLENTNKYKL